MSRAFFGNVASTLEMSISPSSLSASKSAITSSIASSATNTGNGILSYLWQTTGNTCTINTPSNFSTTVTGGGLAGTTDLFCNITNSVTQVTTSSPTCVITWNPSTSIISVTWSIPSAQTSTYDGAAKSVTVSSVNPAAATYSLATTTATNAGSIASTILTGTGDYDGTFTSPNLTIGTSTITIASSGSTSFTFTGGVINVGFTVSGVYATDTNYSVSGTSATNSGNYTVTLSETSSNYTLGSPSTFGWAITPTSIISVTWSIPSAQTSTYDGAAKSVTVSSVNPAAATYSLATTTATNAGSIASTILTGTGNYGGTFTSPNLTIGTSTITIASSGSTSFTFTGGVINVGFTVSGVYATDTNYSVSGTSATNCDNYTVTLSETSSNYTLGSPSTFGWAITPTAPANFTVPVPATPTSGQTTITVSFSWTAVGGCSYTVKGDGGGGYITVATAGVGVTTASYVASVNANYTFYVEAVANSGTSSPSRIANVFTGTAPYTQTIPYDSGWANQQPLCLTGSASGTIGFKNFPQGTYGIIISQVGVQNASCNFATSLLWGTATRTIRWNLNGTAVNFPLSTSTSAPNPYAGPTFRNTTTSGTITYTMVASGTGWSTNNSSGVSGSTWARAEWKWTGTQPQTVAAVPCTVSYT